MRKSTIIIGAITPEAKTNLATGDISPQQTFAPNIDKCPFRLKSDDTLIKMITTFSTPLF